MSIPTILIWSPNQIQTIKIHQTALANVWNKCHKNAKAMRWIPTDLPIDKKNNSIWRDYVVKDFCPNDNLWIDCLAREKEGGIPELWRGLVWQAILCMPASLPALYDQWIILNQPLQPQPHSHSQPQPQLQPQTSLERLRDALTDQLDHLSTETQVLVDFLSTVVSEKEAFCVFVRWMETENLHLVTLNSKPLKERLGLLDSVLAQTCPILHQHFAHHDVRPEMYAASWYQTLMCNVLPRDCVLRTLDLILLEGSVSGVTRIAIALLKANQCLLLAIHSQLDIIRFLTSEQLVVCSGYNDSNPGALLKDAMALSAILTPAAIDQLLISVSNEIDQTQHQRQKPLPLPLEVSTATETLNQIVPIDNDNIMTPIYQSNASIPSTVIVDPLTKHCHVGTLDSPISGPLSNRSSLLTLSQKSCGTHQTAETLVDWSPSNTTNTNTNNNKNLNESDMFKKQQKEINQDYLETGWDAAMLGRVTSELVDIKLGNFEMSQKYETMCHAYQHVLHQLGLLDEVDGSLVQKTQDLESTIKLIKEQNAKTLEENDALARQGKDLEKGVVVARTMVTELSLERDTIAGKVERLACQVAKLEAEKARYYVPLNLNLGLGLDMIRPTTDNATTATTAISTGSQLGDTGICQGTSNAITESPAQTTTTVTATDTMPSQTFVSSGAYTEQLKQNQQQKENGHKHKQARRCTLSQMSTRIDTNNRQMIDEEARYVQSELRCRELEKMLAETKVQLAAQEAEVKTYTLHSKPKIEAEIENTGGAGSLSFLSKRMSLTFPTRPMSVQYKKPARPFTLPAVKAIPADRSDPCFFERHDIYQGR
ncbi:rab-GTPase-TBC domain-containing protein [Phycomyces blakesleeanus]